MRRGSAPLALALVALALPAPAATAGGLCRQMKEQLTAGGGEASGLYVVDAETGAPVCASAAGRRRPLASNMKLFTTGTALTRFGPRARITTAVYAGGTLDPATGIIQGSLYLKGGGDPALGLPAFYDRYLGGVGTDLLDLAQQLHEDGIHEVTGRLYGDASVFDSLSGVADSGYATSPWIGPLSGLDFDSGYRGLSASRFAPDPARLAAATLAQALRGDGVRIRHGVALGTTPAEAQPLASVQSPTMTTLVATTDTFSDNFFAEMLMKLIGARFGGEGSTRAGARVVEGFARAMGSGVHAVDGSGLTRTNRASPSEIVRFLAAMRRSRVSNQFIGDLAVAGHDGTVALRMKGTDAQGRCHTKTGTLTGVSNLSGYCFNRSGRVMIFSILMGSVRDLELAHAEQDRIAAAVASY